jgi:SAM-dependent methyltransferase
MGVDSLAKALDLLRASQAGDRTIEANELDLAIDSVVGFTADSYSRHSERYAEARGQRTTPLEERLIAALLSTVRRQIAEHHAPPPAGPRWRLLEIGAGSGRDLLRLAEERDVEPVALDNSPGIVRHLKEVAAADGLPPESVVQCDMRDLSLFSSASFHCVRNHASLHHLPLAPGERGADAAIAESRRVLVDGGVLYVLVRAGEGLTEIDTEEGLGPRVFQLFSAESLADLLARHDLRTLHVEQLNSRRGQQDLCWLFCTATAV